MAAPQPSIGPYRITSKLGAGGMGEVWRATDSRLQRDVAIKVLPPAFATDAMRMARFTREAQVLASLNHPGIATIHGVEQDALIMELVEGATLAERIAQGPIPLEEALPIAIQIAEALEYAHERGVVHRDLKPANIKVTPDGRVKILDFGLAKAVSVDSESSALPEATTLNSPATMVGAILGTAAYMSPEQARGKSVDRRADIWAFGVVLYEMLVGTRPFVGEDLTETLAAVVKTEPAFDALPEPARGVTQRCLQKDPRARWGWIGDARHALLHPVNAELAPAAPARTHLMLHVGWGAVAALLLALGALAWWLKPVPALQTIRFSEALPPGLAFHNPGRHVLAISPDGSKIVYNAGDGHLYVRSLNALDAQMLPGTPSNLREPIFSPDGQSIAYFVAGPPDVLQRIPVGGGAPVTLCTLKGNVYGASWSDGRIVFGDGNSGPARTSVIEAIPDTGGTPQVLAALPGTLATQPQLVDHGRRLLFAAFAEGDDAGQIVIQDVNAPASRRTILGGGTNPHLLPDGRLLYIRDGTIFGVTLNMSKTAIAGTPVPLLMGVAESTNSYAGQYAIANTGTLVYRPGGVESANNFLFEWVDRQGKETNLGAPVRNYGVARLSPNGKLVAVTVTDSAFKQQEIWIWDTVRATLSRLTFGPGLQGFPNWSPDGRYVYYRSQPSNSLFRKSADGSGPAEPVAPDVDSLDAIAPDGKTAVIQTAGQNSQMDMLPLQAGSKPQPLMANAQGRNWNASISPDGRWIAYESNETGATQIYVRPFPNANTGRWQISATGGANPVWSRDGHLLYYETRASSNYQLVGVSVEVRGNTFSAGAPQVLFSLPHYINIQDVTVDSRILARTNALDTESLSQSITIVTHWTSEVAARVH